MQDPSQEQRCLSVESFRPERVCRGLEDDALWAGLDIVHVAAAADAAPFAGGDHCHAKNENACIPDFLQ